MTLVATPTMVNQAQQTGRYIDVEATENERNYGLFNHLMGLIGLSEFGGVLALIGCIIMWRIKADQSPFLDDHGREAVNFQISLLVYFIGGAVVSLGMLIPLLIPAMIILRLIGCIRGAMAAHRGEYYRYPMCIRFISEP